MRRSPQSYNKHVPPSQHGLASARAPRGSVLAIDYGRKRLGLALSDALGVTARPLAVWLRSNRRGDISRLRETCRTHAVGAIVVGWPLHLDGSPGEMAQEAARFADRLRKDLRLPVQLIDERLSSWEARRSNADNGSRRTQGRVDDVAAAIILRDYLSRARRAERG